MIGTLRGVTIGSPILMLQHAKRMPAPSTFLSPDETGYANGLTDSHRRNAWLLRRWTAKNAVLAWLGIDCTPAYLAAIEIRPDANGAPEAWVGDARVGVSLSVTQRDQAATCYVASRDIAVGCDLEVVAPRSPTFATDYYSAAEQAWVAAGDDHMLRTTLVWSAKESTLKALRVAQCADTRDVEVMIDPVRPMAWSRLRVHAWPWCRELFGWWRAWGPYVLCVVSDHPTPPPETR